MNDLEPFDGPDLHLSERMERAVNGLRAPDVVPGAIARGRRQRTHRRLLYAAGGIAASTALVLSVPTFAADWPGRGATGPSVGADPAATGATSGSPTTAAPGTGAAGNDSCDRPETGWWSKSTAQIRTDLSALLPDGTRIGETDAAVSGAWGGTLVTGEDADGTSLTLLPPAGVLGPRRTLEELSSAGPCAGGANEPLQAVKSCDEFTGQVACAEIRSEGGTVVGVVTEKLTQPAGQTYLLAVLAVPGGGHVELVVSEGTTGDGPGTVQDPADVPALSMDQMREIVTDPVWTS